MNSAKTFAILIGLVALAGGQSASAQSAATKSDMSQDRAQMARDDRGMAVDSAHVRADNARLRTLKTRLAHETGASRAATQSQIDRIMADSQRYRNQDAALGANDHSELKDAKHDRMAPTPH